MKLASQPPAARPAFVNPSIARPQKLSSMRTKRRLHPIPEADVRLAGSGPLPNLIPEAGLEWGGGAKGGGGFQNQTIVGGAIKILEYFFLAMTFTEAKRKIDDCRSLSINAPPPSKHRGGRI